MRDETDAVSILEVEVSIVVVSLVAEVDEDSCMAAVELSRRVGEMQTSSFRKSTPSQSFRRRILSSFRNCMQRCQRSYTRIYRGRTVVSQS